MIPRSKLKVGARFSFVKYPEEGIYEITGIRDYPDVFDIFVEVVQKKSSKHSDYPMDYLQEGNLIFHEDKKSEAQVTDSSAFSKIGEEVGKLVGEKQVAYGDSFGRSGECLRQMYPDGIKPDQYDDLLTIARVLDKLFRIASNPEAFGENPYKDIVGYGILGMNRYENKENK